MSCVRSYNEIFDIYNFVGYIFRSLINEDDKAAKKVTSKYQDFSILSEEEEEFVKNVIITKETKTITKPYTVVKGSNTYRVYLLNKDNIKSDLVLISGSKLYKLPAVFSEYNELRILVIEKEQFVMENMYDNLDDKIKVINFFTKIFYDCISDYTDPNNPSSRYISSILGLLFFFQATGTELSKEDYTKAINIRANRLGDIDSGIYYDVVQKILSLDEIPNVKTVNAPFITQDDVIRKIISSNIRRSVMWGFADEVYNFNKEDEDE